MNGVGLWLEARSVNHHGTHKSDLSPSPFSVPAALMFMTRGERATSMSVMHIIVREVPSRSRCSRAVVSKPRLCHPLEPSVQHRLRNLVNE